ncbi:MAG: MprA protease, GlyGly-CTERM protein-sorting domain-containing form [Fuerstiella sp.]|nr:MprA protease, GlyGly-CTERM protein-sorting domain-containing form [Fuerstiella sp.]
MTLDTSGKLLATVDVLHFLPGGTDPNTAVGHTFNLTLVDSTFVDGSNNEILDVTSNVGLITISAASVPEPTTGVLLMAGLLAFAWRKRRRSPGACGSTT